MEYKVAGIIRTSPTGKKDRNESVQGQRIAIEFKIKKFFSKKYPYDTYRIVWFVDDSVSGDDPNRTQLLELFKIIDTFHFAFVRDVDRFSRSYLGIMWFHEYFLTDRGNSPHKGCKLIFCNGIGDLYNEDNSLNVDSYLAFFIYCGIAQGELIRIRQRCKAGRERKKRLKNDKV